MPKRITDLVDQINDAVQSGRHDSGELKDVITGLVEDSELTTIFTANLGRALAVERFDDFLLQESEQIWHLKSPTDADRVNPWSGVWDASYLADRTEFRITYSPKLIGVEGPFTTEWAASLTAGLATQLTGFSISRDDDATELIPCSMIEAWFGDHIRGVIEQVVSTI